MLYLIQYLFCMLVLGRKPHRHVYGQWFVKENVKASYRLETTWLYFTRIEFMRVCPCGSHEMKVVDTQNYVSEDMANDAGVKIRDNVLASLNLSSK